MFERFTNHARQIVVDAREQARRLGHRHVGTEHLLLLVIEADAGAGALLRDAGLTPDAVRAAITRLHPAGGISDEDAAALRRIGIDIQTVRAKLEESFGPGAMEAEEPTSRFGPFGRQGPSGLAGPRWAPRAKKVLELSLREALRLKHTATVARASIGTEHILLGLIREGHGLATQIMVEAGVDLPALRRATEESFRPAA